MTSPTLKPLVGVISDVRRIDAHDYHVAGEKYLLALTQAADVIPVLIPALPDECDIEQWLSRIDGVFLTGAYSMADPALYGEARLDRPFFYDPQRDAQSAALIHGIRARNKPLLAVCRGLQDINIALGGSLHQAVHEVDGMLDHREDLSADIEGQYGPAHDINLTPDGLMEKILGQSRITVNSVHSQGIKRLGNGLRAEATADDGLIEAASITNMNFGLGVQWHPEWRVLENPSRKLIFEAFGQACKASAGSV